jgi:peptide deformylase
VAVRTVLTFENPRLRMKSVKVKRVDASIASLIDDMFETMRAYDGAGLAAPQIGVLLRVIVAQYPDEDEESEEVHEVALVNPEIIAREGEWMAEEGCLSVPGYVGTVKRALKVTVKAKDARGKEIRVRADGRLAHILQHEIDHLDGILYYDYLDSFDSLEKIEPTERRRRRRRRGPDDEADPETAEAEEPVLAGA